MNGTNVLMAEKVSFCFYEIGVSFYGYTISSYRQHAIVVKIKVHLFVSPAKHSGT